MDRERGVSFQSIKAHLLCRFADWGLKFLLQNLIRPIVVKFFLRDREDTCQGIMSVMTDDSQHFFCVACVCS